MKCKLWEPKEKTRTPKTRNTLVPLYPVYYSRLSETSSKFAWWWLHECDKCGAERIFNPTSGARICKCQQTQYECLSKQKVEVTCEYCGKKFIKNKYTAQKTDRHYCTKRCGALGGKKHKATAEYLAMSNKPRDENLSKLKTSDFEAQFPTPPAGNLGVGAVMAMCYGEGR